MVLRISPWVMHDVKDKTSLGRDICVFAAVCGGFILKNYLHEADGQISPSSSKRQHESFKGLAGVKYLFYVSKSLFAFPSDSDHEWEEGDWSWRRSEINFQVCIPTCMYDICVLPHSYSHREAIQRVQHEEWVSGTRLLVKNQPKSFQPIAKWGLE